MELNIVIFSILVVALAVCNVILYFIMKKRAESILKETRSAYETDKFEYLSKTSGPFINNQQTMDMAEANLKLLENQERLESQKLDMAAANLRLLELKEQIEEEKERSEKLLLNILPARVAKDLKEKGESIPESFDNVTVFFSDIVDFTKITSAIDPQIVIRELSDIFTEFDRIFVRNHCERIKTIGDAYMSVSGMPEPDPRHYANILNAALETLVFLKERNSADGMEWMMRMGIHTGSVVGGIVGVEKYLYDVFGDTINTAARMERYSEPMRVNVSGETFSLAREEFIFTQREPVNVKGKGTIQMYFLDGLKQSS